MPWHLVAEKFINATGSKCNIPKGIFASVKCVRQGDGDLEYNCSGHASRCKFDFFFLLFHYISIIKYWRYCGRMNRLDPLLDYAVWSIDVDFNYVTIFQTWLEFIRVVSIATAMHFAQTIFPSKSGQHANSTCIQEVNKRSRSKRTYSNPTIFFFSACNIIRSDLLPFSILSFELIRQRNCGSIKTIFFVFGWHTKKKNYAYQLFRYVHIWQTSWLSNSVWKRTCGLYAWFLNAVRINTLDEILISLMLQ